MTIWGTLKLWENIRGISLRVLAPFFPALNVDLITEAAAAIYLESLLGDSGKTKQNKTTSYLFMPQMSGFLLLLFFGVESSPNLINEHT